MHIKQLPFNYVPSFGYAVKDDFNDFNQQEQSNGNTVVRNMTTFGMISICHKSHKNHAYGQRSALSYVCDSGLSLLYHETKSKKYLNVLEVNKRSKMDPICPRGT